MVWASVGRRVQVPQIPSAAFVLQASRQQIRFEHRQVRASRDIMFRVPRVGCLLAVALSCVTSANAFMGSAPRLGLRNTAAIQEKAKTVRYGTSTGVPLF
mgnify:CR=1 FL=1